MKHKINNFLIINFYFGTKFVCILLCHILILKSLFLFVIITSGIFYLPINRWEYRISEKNRIALEKKIKKRNAKIRALKNLKRTANQLSQALTT